MLNVNNVLPTPYKLKKMKILCSTTLTKDENEDEDERRKRRSKKNSRKKKVNFQNKCVSSQKIRMRKEEGATVAATPTFSQRADATVGRKAVSTEEVQTIGKYS